MNYIISINEIRPTRACCARARYGKKGERGVGKERKKKSINKKILFFGFACANFGLGGSFLFFCFCAFFFVFGILFFILVFCFFSFFLFFQFFNFRCFIFCFWLFSFFFSVFVFLFFVFFRFFIFSQRNIKSYTKK